MKRQVVVIHGGETFDSYEEYFKYLLKYEIDFENLFRKGWKGTLGEALGEGYEIIAPRMPSAMNAKYAEWKIYFEKYIPYLRDGVVLVGHSLGGSFLAKYLAENEFPRTVHATFLIAPPYDRDGGRKMPDFVPPQSLALLEKQGGNLLLYHSEDDPIVAFSEQDAYKIRLPHATVRVFRDRAHFDQETFPELVADIKALN